MLQAAPAVVKNYIIDEEEFFAPQFDYDFTRLTDTETYWRGGEKYERPCGWYRFGLKVNMPFLIWTLNPRISFKLISERSSVNFVECQR